MDKTSNISTLTTIGIDRQTGKLIDKLCKRYSLKKGEIVRLAFVYIDKACINPSEAPESVKSELAKINKRQDDIIRFIRHYEEEQLNPMIRTANSIAVRFDTIGKTLETLILSQLESSREKQTAVLQKVSEQFSKHADVINQQIAHHAGFLTADVDLRYRAKTAHGQPFDDAVGATYIESDILCPSLAFPYHFAAFLQNKAAAAIAG